jgi:hypothetical protein
MHVAKVEFIGQNRCRAPPATREGAITTHQCSEFSDWDIPPTGLSGDYSIGNKQSDEFVYFVNLRSATSTPGSVNMQPAKHPTSTRAHIAERVAAAHFLSLVYTVVRLAPMRKARRARQPLMQSPLLLRSFSMVVGQARETRSTLYFSLMCLAHAARTCGHNCVRSLSRRCCLKTPNVLLFENATPIPQH